MAKMLEHARRMRKAPASTERLLWRLLRDRQVEHLKFRRQVQLGPYIVDFACMRHRIVIEADGPFHDTKKDAERDAWLEQQGFKVLRLTNAEIVVEPEKLLQRLRDATDASLDADRLFRDEESPWLTIKVT